MITIQVKAETIKDILPILEKEMSKNPNGYIDIKLVSNACLELTPSWSSEVDV